MLIDLNKDGDSSPLWKLLSLKMEAILKEKTFIVPSSILPLVHYI
jgi:hypothetical protein